MAILLTESYQQISTISLTYGEIRTYAKYSIQDKESNRTTYQIKTTYYIPTQSKISFDNATATIRTDDGETNTKNYGYTTFYRGETTIQEVERVSTHYDDGNSRTKTITTSWTASFGGNGSISADVYFPKIDRYPMLTSAPNFNDEENPTITYTTTMGFSNATLSACISLDGQTDTIPYRTISVIDGNYTFELTNAERTTLRQASANSNSLPVTFILKTTVNNTNYFSKMSAIMSIVNANPTFTYAIEETNQDIIDFMHNAHISTWTYIYANISNTQITIEPEAKKGATISRVEITNDNQKLTLRSSPYITTITPTASNFSVSIADSRTNKNDLLIIRYVVPYIKVKINSFSFKRQNPTSSNIIVNLDCQYYQIPSITDPTTGIPHYNEPVVQYKLDNGNFVTIPSRNYNVDSTNHKITITNYTISNALDYRYKGDFTIKITDGFSTTQDTTTVLKGIPTIDLGEHDLQVNGDLYVADTDRENAVNVLDKINSIPTIINGTNQMTFKLPNNIMINTQRIPVNTNITTSWRNHYISGVVSLGSFKTAFANLYACTISLESSNGRNAWFMTNATAGKTNAGNIYLISAESTSGFQGYINIIAIGSY